MVASVPLATHTRDDEDKQHAAAERPPPSDPCFYGAPTCNARLRSADLPARLRARSEQLLRDSRVSLRRRFGAIGERFG